MLMCTFLTVLGVQSVRWHLISGTLQRSNSDFSAHRMHVWRESATAVRYIPRTLLAVKQVACTTLENAHFYAIRNGGHVTDLKDLIG